jgi:hypothetical protein
MPAVSQTRQLAVIGQPPGLVGDCERQVNSADRCARARRLSVPVRIRPS